MTRGSTIGTEQSKRVPVARGGRIAVKVAIAALGLVAAGCSFGATIPAANGGGGGMSGSGSAGSGSGMGGMGGMGGSGNLSLPTTSPAGPITWPLPMGSMEPGMQMVTPDCTSMATSDQQQAAVQLVNSTVAAVSKYQSLDAAKADGYIPITRSGATTVHYAKPAYMKDGNTLDPNAIESLVYANTSHGAVLVAAMYTLSMNQVGDQNPPMPGGCLTEWHIHTNLCFSDSTGLIVGQTSGGICPGGSINKVTQPMIHVWVAPIPGGPLAVDASSAQILAAAEQLPAPAPSNGTA